MIFFVSFHLFIEYSMQGSGLGKNMFVFESLTRESQTIVHFFNQTVL